MTTDRERLDAAFAAMERAGLIARQSAIALDDVDDEQVFRTFQGRPARGYCFFDGRIGETGELHLSFGSFGQDPIAEAIVAQLRAAGLRARWSGAIDERIVVELSARD